MKPTKKSAVKTNIENSLMKFDHNINNENELINNVWRNEDQENYSIVKNKQTS